MRLAVLVGPRPGLIIFGSQRNAGPAAKSRILCEEPLSFPGMFDPNVGTRYPREGSGESQHSREGLNMGVEREVVLIGEGPGARFYWLTWSVERL